MRDLSRDLGIIDHVGYDHDHGHPTLWLGIAFKGGSYQSFGGLFVVPEELAADYVADLCAAFKVDTVNDLVGKEVIALRSYNEWSANIVGVESEYGLRFTHYGWRKKHFPNEPTPLEMERQRLRHVIELNERQTQELRAQLETLEERYHDWG